MGDVSHLFSSVPLDARVRAETDELSFILRPAGDKGIGVFATHGILRGTRLRLFAADEVPRRISEADAAANPLLAQCCGRWGVEVRGGWSTAPDFGRMSVGWYMNHSDTPNAHCDDEFEFFALHDISAGEEVSVDYGELHTRAAKL
jgi:hypothetical protein